VTNIFKEETSMSDLRYPNESREFRDARDLLLKDERELADKVKAVAAKRRNLPLGGQLKEDYVFQWANDGKVGKSVKFSELFADKNTLLLYSFMYGLNWDNTLRLSQLQKPRPIESMRGRKNADGRKSRWFPDRTLPIKQITNARKTLMICNCR
jgi:hypothetical protein